MSRSSVGVATGAVALLLSIAGASGVTLAQSPQNAPPKFTATVEYVEVDARVLDANGAPVRDLTQRDFQVLENGVPQDLANFSAVNIALPPSPAADAAVNRSAVTVRPDVATNARPRDAQRIYLILLDDLFVEAKNTTVVRSFMKVFIERSIGPGDLVAITSTGDGSAFENFTSDKARLSGAIDRFIGQKGLSPTVASNLDLDARSAFAPGNAAGIVPPERRVGVGSATKGENPEGRRVQQRLLHVIQAMSGIEGGSKAIIYVSEGLPFDRLANDNGLNLEFELLAVSAMARRINVPVYPVDPRGLTQGTDVAIELGRTDINDSPTANVRNEIEASLRRLRYLADDTGGFAVLATNDPNAGLDRVVTHTSSYYLLGYYPKDTRHDGKFRRIEIKVGRPGVTVMARRGYLAPPAKEPKKVSQPGPAGTSDQVRDALNNPMPLPGLTLSATAAAFRDQHGQSASVAVVLEGAGADLDLTERNGLLAGTLDLLTVALEPAGAIKASDTAHLQLSMPTNTGDRMRREGFRWLSRLNDIKPGRYQIRVVAANGLGKQGSVWYDLDIPDFGKEPLAMSDVMLASASAFQTPTLRPDKLMGDALPGPATAVRRFPAGDSIATFAEVYDNRLDQPHALDTSIVIRNERGAEIFRSADTRSNAQLRESNGMYRSRAAIALGSVAAGSYVLTVEARRNNDAAVAVSRSVPFQIVAAGSR